MSTVEILNELPRLSPAERRAICQKILELEADQNELRFTTEAADAGFQQLDELERQDNDAA